MEYDIEWIECREKESHFWSIRLVNHTMKNLDRLGWGYSSLFKYELEFIHAGKIIYRQQSKNKNIKEI